MKKLLTAGMTFAVAFGVFAQGSLTLNDQKTKSGNQNGTDSIWHVYSPDLTNPQIEYQGNTATLFNSGTGLGDYPVGTQSYSGTLLGGFTTGGTSATSWGNGANYTMALYGTAGAGVSGATALNSGLSLLAGSLTPFATVGGAAFAGLTALTPTITVPNTSFSGDNGPNAGDTTSATVEAAAWYNNGGTITTLAEAVAAAVPYGEGNVFTVNNLGGGSITPPNTLGGTSFSLTSVPEPSTIALGVMGACAFLARRRKQ